LKREFRKNLFKPRRTIVLMEMFEISDPVTACEQFALLMVEEKADPIELSAYIKKVMKKWKKKRK